MSTQPSLVKTHGHTAAAHLTAASVIAMGGLSLYLTENYSEMLNDGRVSTTEPGDNLRGTYADAFLGVSILVVVLIALCMFACAYAMGCEAGKGNKAAGQKMSNVKRFFKWAMGGTLVFGLVAAAMNINVVENFSTLHELVDDEGNLRGTHGYTTLVFNCLAIAAAALTHIFALACMLPAQKGSKGGKGSKENEAGEEKAATSSKKSSASQKSTQKSTQRKNRTVFDEIE